MENTLSNIQNSQFRNDWFFGAIPQNWLIVPLKHLCTKYAIYGANLPSSEYINEGVRFLRTTDINENGTLSKDGVFVHEDLVVDYILSDGDILISRSGTLGRSYLHKDTNGICAYAGYLVRFIIDKKNNSKFIFYLTKTQNFNDWISFSAIEATIGNVNGEKYANLPLPVPPMNIQDKIVSYLDHEIPKIDYFIDLKDKLINLLTEKRQALILHAITNGLNSSVIVKPSGIEWLGNVPEHWIVERTRWLFKERNERSETGDEEMLSVSHLTGVTPRSEKNVNMFEAESTEGYKKCFPGDLVINTLWAWMGAMGIAPVEGIVSPAYHVYTPTSAILPEFIDAIVRLPIFATEVTRYSKGVWSSRLRLYPEGFYEVYLPVPPLEEQKQIVKFIKDETEKIDRLKNVTEKSIELLKERRTALITAAVTGQIEIPSDL